MIGGKLRTRITFEAPTSVPDPQYNESVQIWTPQLTTWASVVPVRGAMLSLAQARATTATATHTITVRYNARVNNNWRVKIGGSVATAAVPVSWDSFDDDSWTNFGGDVAGNASGVEAPPRHFTLIGPPLDESERHRMQTFLAIEVV